MSKEYERIATLETESKVFSRNITELWNKVNDLMNFKNQVEGGFKTVRWLLLLVGASNIAMLIRLFVFAGK